MIVLYILLGLLCLIALFLCIPVHAIVRYNTELELDIRYLFLKFAVLPEQDKPEQKPAPVKKTTEKAAKPKEKKPNAFLQTVRRSLKAEGFNGFMELIGAFVRLTGTTVVQLIKKLRIREFDLYVMTAGPDAAAAAILYGKTCAVIYPAAEMLFRLVPCKKHGVSVDLDYSITEPYVKMEADVSILPIYAVYYAILYLKGVIPLFKRFTNPVNRKKTNSPSAINLKR